MVAHVKARFEASARGLGGAETLADLLPTTSYRDYESGDSQRYSDLVVVGRIIESTAGRTFANQDPNENGPDSIEVEPGDPRAAWATIHIVVEPDTLITHQGLLEGDHEPVYLGLTVAVDPSVSLSERVDEMGRVDDRIIAFLQEGSRLFSYDSSVHGVLLGGALLGTVAQDGALNFPVMDGEGSLLAGQVTLAGLISEASNPREIDVVRLGALILRADDAEGLALRGMDISMFEPAPRG